MKFPFDASGVASVAEAKVREADFEEAGVRLVSAEEVVAMTALQGARADAQLDEAVAAAGDSTGAREAARRVATLPAHGVRSQATAGDVAESRQSHVSTLGSLRASQAERFLSEEHAAEAGRSRGASRLRGLSNWTYHRVSGASRASTTTTRRGSMDVERDETIAEEPRMAAPAATARAPRSQRTQSLMSNHV